MPSLVNLLIFAAAQTAAVSPNVAKIVVQGLGEAKTPANVALLSYDVQGEGKTSDEAVRALVAKIDAVENALAVIDRSVDLRSDSVEVSSVRPTACKDDDYGRSPLLSTGECAIVGFVAEQEFTVRTTRVNDAGTMVALAARHGASNPKIESFRLSDDREGRRQAIAAALANARDKAEAIAAASNTSLGRTLSVSLDGASDEEIVVTGTLNRSLPRFQADAPITVRVNPGPVETTARVTVSYAIDR